MNSFKNVAILFSILVVVGFFHNRYELKLKRETEVDTNTAIQNYLLDDVTLGKSKKPILWIHVPYEYNSRQWLSFGSRSSFELNQPYLYLTFRSIIKQCEKSFTVCVIDDTSFKRLIPGWNINMTNISDPILPNMRMLGMMKLLYIYGGLICPLSFVCLNNLNSLYENGIRGKKMFVCETVNRTISSTTTDFIPSLTFCGAPRECLVVRELCNVIERTASNDCTADVKFVGEYEKWCARQIENTIINLIDGKQIGTKTNEHTPVIIDDLLSNNYLDLYKGTYGILIPSCEILSRVKFEWFSRMSQKQVMESNTILGNYILLSQTDEQGILESIEPQRNEAIENKFVSFWKMPSDAPYYGLKPNLLGNNLQKTHYPEN